MLRAKYYNSIDTLPAFVYFKIVDENALHLLTKKHGIFGNVLKAFENIQRQLVDRFGISENYAEIIELQREICELKCDVAITENKFQNTFIHIKEAELKKILEQKGLKTQELKTILEKWLGFKLNLHEISIAEWFEYLQTYSKQQPQQSE